MHIVQHAHRVGLFFAILTLSQAETPPDWLVTEPGDLDVRIEAIDSFHKTHGNASPSEPVLASPPVSGAVEASEVSVTGFAEARRLADEAFEQRDWKKSLSYTTAALKVEPMHRYMRYQNAYALAHLGRHKEAIVAYEALIEDVPDYRDAWYQKAWSLQKLGRHAEALKAYDKALQSGARSSWIYYDKGILLKRMGRRDEAVAAFESSAELNPKHVWSSLEIANILFDRRDWANASRWYEKVMQIRPSAPDAAKRLKICQKKLAR